MLQKMTTIHNIEVFWSQYLFIIFENNHYINGLADILLLKTHLK